MERSPGTIVIWLVAAVLAVLVGARLFAGGGGAAGEPVRVESEGAGGGARRSTGRPSSERSGPLAVVHVAGAVRKAGLYRLPAGARIATALERAGGPLPRAELASVNLAARVQDGQQIIVPRTGSGAIGAVSSAGGTAGAAAGPKPSLASATVEQLEQLDGIGPTLAERIVEYRQVHGGFRSIDELAQIDGIGTQRLKSLREALQP